MTGSQDPQADHPRLDRLFLEVGRLNPTEDLASIRELWLDLERELRRHLAREEASLIPRYRTAGFATEARALEAAHDEFRALLREICEQLDLDSLDVALAEALSRSYRVHQIREDTTLYRWARENHEK